ncbi:MAG: hypothetical protein D6728_02985 [Cyanobacteria bacterium J055]|nr:MAG: hypothetical protein D6728_02985 [Cyanobacteria bacterium J055]
MEGGFPRVDAGWQRISPIAHGIQPTRITVRSPGKSSQINGVGNSEFRAECPTVRISLRI